MTTFHDRHSILIVEDEQIVAKDIQQTLDELGYDAFAIASSAEEAVERASERCPDLVLMDIRIDGKRDGIETARILKTRFGIPVVYLTAHADDATIERAKKTEPHGYLVKPVKAAELHSVVEVSLYKHEMEKRLRERERWFSTTLRSIADAVIAVDLAGIVTFMNPAAEALTGSAANDAIGKPARDILRLMKDHAADADETPLATALREKRAVELQEQSLLNIATGARRLINDSAAPVIDEGETLGAVMVFRDVTEQKNLQKQLELADRLASLGTMSAGIAHEVNNPLAVIMANSSYIAEELARYRAELGGPPPPAAARRLDDIAEALTDVQSASDRIVRIVSDLRAFSRPAQPSAGLIDVESCLDWAVRTTSHELRHRAKLVTRFREVPAVRGDDFRLAQVFINLLVNAAHAINPGNAEKNEVTITTSTDEKGWIVVEIADTGEGIPQENLSRIFEPFFTTKAGDEGTGLGLSICQGIVRSLGGQLLVESEVGKGTRFFVLLPPSSQKPAETKSTASRPPTSFLRGRILVVDDEPQVLHTIKRILQDQELVCTNSPQEALALIERGERFDLILSDVMMPAMTGVQLYEALLPRHPALARRMVFLSAGALTAKIDAFLRSIPNRWIEKPFEVASLRESIQKALRGLTAAA